ncbi:MAG: cysteine desulfurase [Clostridiales bacterium]|nr:cysteine desulfurase [Clostridiales bacterium]
MRIYLDNCASTQVSSEAAKAIYFAMTENYANPSALHLAGQEAERLVKQARHQIAFSIGTKSGNIIFTSGGTEANNLALFSCFYSDSCDGGGDIPGKPKALLISAVEHPAVYAAADALARRGARVERIPVFGADTDFPGMVDVSAFRAMLADDVSLVSVLHVSNEIGTIQPIEELSRIVSLHNSENGANIRLHVDAAQSYGKLGIDVDNGDLRRVDFVSMSAHKLHGPKGIGALYAASPAKLHPMVFGGGQEGGVRSGTENVPGIVGFGACARIASAEIVAHAKHANTCRRRLLDGIKAEIPHVHINSPEDASITGKPGCSSPYILSLSFLGTRGEVLVHELEKSGIFVSTGAACATLSKNAGSGKNGNASGVLAAVGASDEVMEGTLRFGISWTNVPDEMDFVIDRLKKAVTRFRRTGSYR